VRLAWTVSPNLLLEGGWMYLIKGSYYSNLLNQGVVGAPPDKNTDYFFFSIQFFFWVSLVATTSGPITINPP
jgi:hypothetical protein